MIEQIKFRSPDRRIDYLLGCLSGVINSPYSKITVLDALYKEIEWELTNEEKIKALELFAVANDKRNMVYSIEGWGRNRTYMHKEEFLNEIELYLRYLLGKNKHYSISTEKTDYQLGEE